MRRSLSVLVYACILLLTLLVPADSFVGARTVRLRESSGAKRKRRLSATAAAATPAATTTTQALSDELLNLLLEKKAGLSSSVDTAVNRIEVLISQLTSLPQPNTYNPMESLYGPLFCTLYTYTPDDPKAPKPLWERISLSEDNLKGQQYSPSDDGQPGSGSVINYSEIWGPTLHIRASGTFVAQDESRVSKNGKPSDKNNPLSGLFENWSIIPTAAAVFNKQKLQQRRTCPDDYVVTVDEASIHLLGTSLDLPISGSSVLRVLYADPQLRIFVSPKASDSIAGEWESKGLVVVQVRSDLVTNDKAKIDLR